MKPESRHFKSDLKIEKREDGRAASRELARASLPEPASPTGHGRHTAFQWPRRTFRLSRPKPLHFPVFDELCLTPPEKARTAGPTRVEEGNDRAAVRVAYDSKLAQVWRNIVHAATGNENNTGIHTPLGTILPDRLRPALLEHSSRATPRGRKNQRIRAAVHDLVWSERAAACGRNESRLFHELSRKIRLVPPDNRRTRTTSEKRPSYFGTLRCALATV